MRCRQCGFDNARTQRFCGGCGVSVDAQRACPACGSDNPATLRYCGQCGTRLEPPPTEDSPAHDAPERRYMTVMFCDLVGSTALSERLDPEELSEIILAYREAVSAVVARFDGYVARYVGDGILIYFGYPRAHGDDPVRAVHAALAILAGVRELSRTLASTKDVETCVHLGVHTGLVVVGELARGAVREEAGVVGETPNLAARLVDSAPPDAVHVSGVTRSLTKDEFEWRDLGMAHMEGLSRAIHVYQVMSVRRREQAMEFGEKSGAATLAGREHEVSFLQERWRLALEGAGQVIAITGEPGIGKSRLIRAFAEGLQGVDHRKVIFNCSPYHANSVFFPVVDYLNRWLEKSDEDKLAQLANAATALGLSAAEVVPIIASLLALPIVAPYRIPQVSARIQREMTMEILVEWIRRGADDRPTLLVVEDLHWSDASSLEFFFLLVNQIRTSRILMLLAFRPDFRAPALLHPHAAHLPLDRLTTSQVHEMIQQVAGEKHLSASVRDQLVNRTDGVPLFVEELTKAVIESNVLVDSEDGYRLPASPIDFDIPMSLHATLMSRLDSLSSAKAVAQRVLSSAKAVAQRAAVLGREFSYELIAAIAPMPTFALERGLAQLVDAELLLQRGLPPRSNYAFKHSMIQETAYRSLLRASRQQHHLQVAEVLISKFPQVPATQPELVAQHYSSAHMAIEAASYWRKAGELALARSANVEAYAHVERGLAELAAAPKSLRRTTEEVLLLVVFGSTLTASKGSAAPEVGQTYARARELCRELEDPAHLFPVLRGLQSFYVVRGPLRTAQEMAEQLRQMAEQTSSTLQRVEAHRRLGWCLFCMGQIDAGRAYLDQALQQYDRAQSAQHILLFGSDPGIIGLANLAWLEWFAGRTDKAIGYSIRSIELARELAYGLGTAYALGMSAALYQCLRDSQATARLAQETIDLAERHGFPYWAAWETSLLGWARATQGQVAVGTELLQKGLEAYRTTGAELFCPYILGMLAQVNLRAGEYDKALACCEDALASSARTDGHFFDAEIHRLEGSCLLSRDHDIAGAQACFEEAIATARAQSARMLELRGVMSLAALCRSQGQAGAACDMLAETLRGFDEGSSASDVAEARRFLEEWREHAGNPP